MIKKVIFTSLCIVLLTIPVLFLPFTTEQFELPKISILLLACGLTAGFVRFGSIKSDKIGIALLAFVASAAISTIFSMAPNVSILGNDISPFGLITIAGLAWFYFICKYFFDNEELNKKALKLSLIPGVIACLYAIFQCFGIDFIVWSKPLTTHSILRPSSTMGHPNFLSAYLVMSLPIVTLLEGRRVKLFVSALFMAVIVLCQSRGAWLALAVEVLVLAWMNGLKSKFVMRFIAAIVALPLLARWFCSTFTEVGAHKSWIYSIVERISLVFDVGLARKEYLIGAIKIFKEHWLVGSGTDTFQLAYEHVRTPFYWLSEWAGAPHRAHCEILNIAATQGILGVLAVVLLGIAIFMTVRVPLTKLHKVLLTIIVGFFIQNLFSFTVITTGVLFVLCLAMLEPIKHAPLSRGRPWATVISLIITGAVAYPISRHFLASYHARTSMRLVKINPFVATAYAKAATTLDPYTDSYNDILASNAHLLTLHSNKSEHYTILMNSVVRGATINPEQAINYYLLALFGIKVTNPALIFNFLVRALSLEPYNPIFWCGSAYIELAIGNPKEALNFVSEAFKRYPDMDILHFYAAESYLAQGKDDLALAEYKQSLNGKSFHPIPERPEVIMSDERIRKAKAQIEELSEDLSG